MFPQTESNPVGLSVGSLRTSLLVEVRPRVGGEPWSNAFILCDLRHGFEWCDQLVYESQREKSNDRALRRAQAIRTKPGGSANMREPLPDKPKRMHWLTCDWAATASCEALH